MIRTNGKMHSRCLCYLDLTAVVKPLNVVGVGVLARGQAKLLDHLGVHQIVAATSIDYGVHTAVFDEEKSVKNKLCRCNLSSDSTLVLKARCTIKVLY